MLSRELINPVFNDIAFGAVTLTVTDVGFPAIPAAPVGGSSTGPTSKNAMLQVENLYF